MKRRFITLKVFSVLLAFLFANCTSNGKNANPKGLGQLYKNEFFSMYLPVGWWLLYHSSDQFISTRGPGDDD